MSQNGIPLHIPQRYEYKNLVTGELYTKYRLDLPDGKKKIWWAPDGAKPEEMCLYNDDLLDDPRFADQDVFLMEGEEKCKALVAHNILAVSFSGSSSQRRFDPAVSRLKGRTVNVWPDNDEPGLKYATAEVDAVRSAGPKGLRLLEPVSSVLGADAADLVEGLEPEAWREVREIVSRYVTDAEDVLAPPPGKTTSGLSIIPVSLLRDALAKPEQAVDWVVENLLHAGGTSALVGPFKAGKSTLQRIAAVCVASGRDFFGRSVSRPRRVGVVTLEEDEADVLAHLRLLCELTGSDDVLDNIVVATGDEWLPDSLEDRIAVVKDTVLAAELDLLLMGPLQDLFGFRNINDYSEVKPVLRKFTNQVARSTRCHVNFDHHANKYGTGANSILGSAAIGGGVDQLLIMSLDEQTGERGLITRQRKGVSITTVVGIQYQPNSLDTTFTAPSEKLMRIDNLRHLATEFAKLCGERWLSGNALVGATGLHKQTALAALEYGVAFGILEQREREGRGGGNEYRANPGHSEGADG